MAEHLSKTDISDWQDALVEWFAENGKSYPWRETTDPYAILASELMLQQTQIRTVLERSYYERWLEKFPDLETLAKASEEEILKAWEGLGYYNRARNLQKTAQHIIQEHNGEFPTAYADILDLPGIGPYTAGAVTSFAFDRPAPIVDGNVIRVLTRVFAYDEPIDTTAGKRQLWEWAEALTSHQQPRAYNSAIMELGQTLCTKGSPKCLLCPVATWCQSRDQPSAQSLPIKQKKTKITDKSERTLLLVDGSQVLLVQETGSRRKGLWRLPDLSKISVPKNHRTHLCGEMTYAITRYRVTMQVWSTRSPKALADSVEAAEWFSIKDLPALGAPYRRAILEFAGQNGEVS